MRSDTSVRGDRHTRFALCLGLGRLEEEVCRQGPSLAVRCLRRNGNLRRLHA